MRFALRHTFYASLPVLLLAACGEAGEDDAQRAAREAADAAQSAGEAVEEGWRSGGDERARLAEETGEAVVAVKAQVRAEWAEHRADRQAALETAGDHVAAAGAAVANGLDAAVDAYADTVDDGVEIEGDDGDRAHGPGHTLETDPHPCADYDPDAEDESDARRARCTPERG